MIKKVFTEDEKEYMDYLIHNRTQLTNQITRHLERIEHLEKKLEIATKALKQYTEKYWIGGDLYYHYPWNEGAWYHAQQALKEMEEVLK